MLRISLGRVICEGCTYTSSNTFFLPMMVTAFQLRTQWTTTWLGVVSPSWIFRNSPSQSSLHCCLVSLPFTASLNMDFFLQVKLHLPLAFLQTAKNRLLQLQNFSFSHDCATCHAHVHFCLIKLPIHGGTLLRRHLAYIDVPFMTSHLC